MRRGFTLIELLVVITILAVLAGAALPYVQSYVEESKIAKAKTDLEEIARALAVYETREGDYTKGDVGDLTGRYLNKAPIDPWGKSYRVATDAGLVKSDGPDRTTGTADDVTAPFQPPLSLVQVKWVDKNQTGAVDIQNVPDQVQLVFSRKITNSLSNLATNLDIIFQLSSGTAATSMTLAFDNTAANMVSLASKAIVLNVLKTGAFTPGSDTIQIKDGHATLKDLANPFNLALASQGVIITPQ